MLYPVLFVFQYFVQEHPAVILIYLISAAVILVASLALVVQVSLPYNKSGRASVLYNFIVFFLKSSLWSEHTVYNKFTCNFQIFI